MPTILIIIIIVFIVLVFFGIVIIIRGIIYRSTFDSQDMQLEIAKDLHKKNMLSFKNFRRRCPKCTNVMYWEVKKKLI